MSLRCKLGWHDWDYKARIYYSDHGSAFQHLNERICKRCGKEEYGSYGTYGPYIASWFKEKSE